MEIENGMYVRTKQGIIDKIMHIAGLNAYGTYYRLVNQTEISFENGLVYQSDILKASHNLVDLIEVGDYVNGEKVVKCHISYVSTLNNEVGYNNYRIKSIVTKQQFEKMQFRVGEDND